MPLHPRTAVRLLTGLLLLAALAGGAWWNSTRLNETERKLVGVWEQVGDSPARKAELFLSDGRHIVLAKDLNGANVDMIVWDEKWSATPAAVTRYYRDFGPITSLRDWWRRGWSSLKGGRPDEFEIVRLTESAFELRTPPARFLEGHWNMRRSTDPELLELFEKLSAGESP